MSEWIARKLSVRDSVRDTPCSPVVLCSVMVVVEGGSRYALRGMT